MAKPLGPKSLVIRQAISAHPDKGNKDIAELINDSQDRLDDKIKVTPQEVAMQKQAMKKVRGDATPSAAGKGGGKKGGRPRQAAAEPQATPAQRPASAGPVDLIDRTLELAILCGGLPQLKRLVERLADMQR